MAVDVVLATPIAIPNQHTRTRLRYHTLHQCVEGLHLHSAHKEPPLAEAVTRTERDEEVDVLPVDRQAVEVLEPVHPLIHPRHVPILGSADLDNVLARCALTVSSLGSANHSWSCSDGRSSLSDIGRDSSTEALQPSLVIWFANIRLAKCALVSASMALNSRRETPESCTLVSNGSTTKARRNKASLCCMKTFSSIELPLVRSGAPMRFWPVP